MNIYRSLAIFFLASNVTGCATGWLAQSGPAGGSVTELKDQVNPPILLVPIDAKSNQLLASAHKAGSFATGLSSAPKPKYLIGPGDSVGVSIWEAPPSVLFAPGLAGVNNGTASSAGSVTFPPQLVSADGTISIPFAGSVKVAGLTSAKAGALIRKRLTGLANDPQVLVQVPNNTNAAVTVVGDVQKSLRFPLSAAGERLLDALAAAGGTKDAVDKETIQVTRGKDVLSLPLRKVIDNPHQNIALAPNDVITLLNKPLSLTVLGAVAKNDEMNFEAQGISLAQALGRAGGLVDNRADARAVFIFRFEKPDNLGSLAKNAPRVESGDVPVIYQLDLLNPSSLLIAQDFPMKHKDVLYVANAPAAEFQKFLTILTSSVYSVYTIVNPPSAN